MDRPPGVVDFTPDPTLYPFTSRWFESSAGPVHYVDEGPPDSDAPTLLLLHGNPDWSFIYRKIIARLRGTFRCVAPDYPGFGLSIHPDGYGYTPAEHAAIVDELVAHLDLRDVVVVGQDWGGPIGMDVASRSPERVRGIAMGNTFFWPATELMPKFFSGVMGSWPMQYAIKQRNFFVLGLMRRMLQVELSDAERAHYTDVVPTPESRRGIAEFPRQITAARPWLIDLQRRVGETLRGKPAALFFGMQDPGLASDAAIGRWREMFPDAHFVELPRAGHFVQEDAPDAIVEAIRARFGPAGS